VRKLFRVREKHSPVFLFLFVVFNLGLVVAIVWLAVITDVTLFWVIAIVIDILIAYLAYSTFRSLTKPKEVLKPLPKPFVYKDKEPNKKKEEVKQEGNKEET